MDRSAALNKKMAYHVLGWLTFILYEVSFVRLIRWDTANQSIFNGYVLPYIINIALFYFHALVVLPFCFGSSAKRWVLCGVFTLLEILLYLLIISVKDTNVPALNDSFWQALFPTKIKVIQHLWRGLYFLIFSTAYWLIQQRFDQERRLQQAEQKALQSEQEKKKLELKLVSTQNAYLQSQISPHLLFNTLNFIHTEVEQVSAKAAEAIIVLSDMMRYSLTETTGGGTILLEKEVEQIHNLITINQFRFNHQLSIEFSVTGDPSSVRLLPLLLLPLVENLFKYAELVDEQHPARVLIQCREGVLGFQTHNKKRKTPKFMTSGIGIENVKRRLESYYPGRYRFTVDDTTDFFATELHIQLEPSVC